MLMLMEAETSCAVIQALSGGWFRVFGPPIEIFGDSDRAWMSAEFSTWCNIYGVVINTTPANAPWQHGQIESLQRVLRHSLVATYDELKTTKIEKQDLLNIVATARMVIAIFDAPRL